MDEIFYTTLTKNDCFYSSVNNLRDQLEDLRKKNQNSHISNEKNIQLQKQVREAF